jgi:succinate dehydrogenase/fumarate reductase-like Fe-S protein
VTNPTNAVLTDGTGVSPLVVPKVVKDLIVDFTKALAAVLIGSNIANAQSALDNPHAVLIAVIGAFFGTLYRFILSWGN